MAKSRRTVSLPSGKNHAMPGPKPKAAKNSGSKKSFHAAKGNRA